MTGLLTDFTTVAKPRPLKIEPEPPPPTRDRIDLRGEPAWIARVQRQANRLGISLSDYIRQAVTLRVEHDEARSPVAD